jgi:hypothetical protein
LISTGLWGVANQEERGKAYRYYIGLFDVCSLPARELTKAVRETSETIYLVADGKKQPAGEMAKSIPAIK